MGIWLTMTTTDGRERPFPLSSPRAIIGRDARCDVSIPLPTVAPRHCEIAVEGALLTLRDLGSATGTLHNGQPVTRAVLEPGDKVTVGGLVTFVVRVDPTSATAPPAANGVGLGPPSEIAVIRDAGAPARPAAAAPMGADHS
jgi:pSer/pThr/pTyr-binding forkhead associated (FHA) protein